MTDVRTDKSLEVDPSVRELISSATKDVSTLVSAQIELAKAELKESASEAAGGIAMLVAAGVMAFLAFIFLLITIAYVLVQLGLPIWAGFGIVTLVLLIVTGILALVGKKHLAKIKGPERTIEQANETKEVLQNLNH